jgi:hypothetical protein
MSKQIEPLRQRMLIPILAACVYLTASVACSGGGNGDDSSTAGASGNLFPNPGFEEGADPWYTLNEESGFTVTDEYAYSGTHSALLNMDDPVEASGQGKVYYLVQDIEPEELPEYVEGYYRVENWERGTPLQYLQFVIIAWAPANFPPTSNNYQLRYIIAGIDSPPFDIGNAHFVFLSREDPVIGEWTKFSANVREDFQRLWNAVPEDFESLRLLFEVRWDYKEAGSGAPRGDVYYDDLYIGDQR